MKTKGIFIFGLLVLASCTSPSKQECQEMDYAGLGYRSGAKGESDNHVMNRYRKVCAGEHGIGVDEAMFKTGYKKGIVTFCSKERGYQLGRLGESYDFPAVCPEKLELGFKKGYKRALISYCSFETGMKVGLDGQVYKGICNGKREDRFLKGYNMGVQKRTLTRLAELESEVSSLRRKLRDKDDEISNLESEVSRLSSDLDDSEHQINNMRSQIH